MIVWRDMVWEGESARKEVKTILPSQSPQSTITSYNQLTSVHLIKRCHRNNHAILLPPIFTFALCRFSTSHNLRRNTLLYHHQASTTTAATTMDATMEKKRKFVRFALDNNVEYEAGWTSPVVEQPLSREPAPGSWSTLAAWSEQLLSNLAKWSGWSSLQAKLAVDEHADALGGHVAGDACPGAWPDADMRGTGYVFTQGSSPNLTKT